MRVLRTKKKQKKNPKYIARTGIFVLQVETRID